MQPAVAIDRHSQACVGADMLLLFYFSEFFQETMDAHDRRIFLNYNNTEYYSLHNKLLGTPQDLSEIIVLNLLKI